MDRSNVVEGFDDLEPDEGCLDDFDPDSPPVGLLVVSLFVWIVLCREIEMNVSVDMIVYNVTIKQWN